MEMLPGYVGHSVAERQHLRARERTRARAGEAPVDLGSLALEVLVKWRRAVLGIGIKIRRVILVL